MGEIQVIEGNGTSARNNKIRDHYCYGARQQEREKNTSQNQHHGEGAMAISRLSTCAHKNAMVAKDRSIAPHAEVLRRSQLQAECVGATLQAVCPGNSQGNRRVLVCSLIK